MMRRYGDRVAVSLSDYGKIIISLLISVARLSLTATTPSPSPLPRAFLTLIVSHGTL